jgi:hypothetical protein
MMKLHVDTGNAAFDDYPATELARILRELAEALEHGDIRHYRRLYDINGNAVGECEISERESQEA